MTDSEEAFPEAEEKDDPGEEKKRFDTRKQRGKSAAIADKKYSKRNGDYKKGVEYLPMKLSDTETLYTGKPSEYWYVQKLPNGEVTKMQMQDVGGELQPVGEEKVYSPEDDGGKSGGYDDK